jgi:hypothetical protein
MWMKGLSPRARRGCDVRILVGGNVEAICLAFPPSRGLFDLPQFGDPSLEGGYLTVARLKSNVDASSRAQQSVAFISYMCEIDAALLMQPGQFDDFTGLSVGAWD